MNSYRKEIREIHLKLYTAWVWAAVSIYNSWREKFGLKTKIGDL